MISNLAKVTVYVNSSIEAKKFWTENMGFVIREEQAMGPGMGWLLLRQAITHKLRLFCLNAPVWRTQIRIYPVPILPSCLPVMILRRSTVVFYRTVSLRMISKATLMERCLAFMIRITRYICCGKHKGQENTPVLFPCISLK